MSSKKPRAIPKPDVSAQVPTPTSSGFGRRIETVQRSVLPWGLVLLLAAAGGVAWAGEADRIAEVLALESGLYVADVGAGDGRWSEALARRVGPTGRVYATEVDEEEVVKIRQRVEDSGLENVTVLVGDQQDTGLEAGCCDAILLRLVYHHFVDPPRMRSSLRRALRPGGRLAIIDILPQENWRELPGVPDRGGHGISPEMLIQEMTADGFEAVERHADWNGDDERYCVVFRRQAEATGDD